MEKRLPRLAAVFRVFANVRHLICAKPLQRAAYLVRLSFYIGIPNRGQRVTVDRHRA